MEKAMFAAGCFWGVEETFRQLKGVTSTMVGYTGGRTVNPRYHDVCTDTTGHTEAVLLEFDPAQISYEELIETFWNAHDPTTMNQDVGTQYRSAIFYFTPEQELAAKASKERAQSHFSSPIVTQIVPASPFYRAEEYHQKYLARR